MDNLPEFLKQTYLTWSNKTLEDLRVQAGREKTGIAFDALRAANGPRMTVVLCVADVEEIARLERVMNLEDDGIIEDWNELTVAEVVVRTFRAGGLTFESLRDEYGRRNALVLVAADPRSVAFIETVLDMPP